MSKERHYIFECLRTPIIDGDIELEGGRYRIELEGGGDGFEFEINAQSSEWLGKIVKALNLEKAVRHMETCVKERVKKSKEDLQHLYKLFRSGDVSREDIALKEREIVVYESVDFLLGEKLKRE